MLYFYVDYVEDGSYCYYNLCVPNSVLEIMVIQIQRRHSIAVSTPSGSKWRCRDSPVFCDILCHLCVSLDFKTSVLDSQDLEKDVYVYYLLHVLPLLRLATHARNVMLVTVEEPGFLARSLKIPEYLPIID